MITFVIGCFALVFSVQCARQARLLAKGEVTDASGEKLWGYLKVSKDIPVAKDRRQALTLMIALSILSAVIGVFMIMPLARKVIEAAFVAS